MKRILVVDDSRPVRLAVRKIAASLDCDSLESSNGEEALERIRSCGDIDAVLLDWNMPVMDGLTFLKTLREAPLERQPVVVMCTTQNDFGRIAEAIQAGANEYIMKPFTADIVREKLEETGVL